MLRRYRLLIVAFVLALPLTAYATVRFNRYSTSGRSWDSDRTPFTLRGINFTAATSEALVTLTPQRTYVDGSTGTSLTITSGKRLRITGACLSVKNAGAAVQGVQVRVRVAAGTVTTSSPVILAMGEGTESATANVAKGNCTPYDQDFAIDLADTFQIGVSQIGTATAGNDFILWGYEYTP